MFYILTNITEPKIEEKGFIESFGARNEGAMFVRGVLCQSLFSLTNFIEQNSSLLRSTNLRNRPFLGQKLYFNMIFSDSGIFHHKDYFTQRLHCNLLPSSNIVLTFSLEGLQNKYKHIR